MKDRVKVGILGLGNAGMAHFMWYRRSAKADVVAVYDPKASQLRRQLRWNPFFRKVPFVDSSEEVFERSDAVSICTPDDTHFAYIVEALNRRKHVLVEKPVVVTNDELRTVRAMREDRPVVFGVHQQMRIVPTFRKIKELLKNDVIGDVFQLEVNYRHDCRQINGLDWRMGEVPQSMLLGGAIHPADYALWLLGDEVREAHLLHNHIAWRAYPLPTNYTIVYKTASDVIVKLNGNGCQVYPFLAEVVVMGDKGTIINNLLYRNGRFEIIHHNRLTFAGYSLLPLNLLLRLINLTLVRMKGFVRPPFTVWEWSFASQTIVENFLDTVRGEAEILVPFETAAASVEFCLNLEAKARAMPAG